MNEGPKFESQEEHEESQGQRGVQGEEMTPLFGGNVPEHRLWQTRVNSTTGEELGYVNPKGQFHALEKGAKFVIERDRAKNSYEALEIGADGTRTTIAMGELTSERMEERALSPKAFEDLDRDRLNKLVEKTSPPGALFGRDVKFEKEDREQIELLVSKAERLIEAAKQNDLEWRRLEDTIEDLEKKGYIQSFVFPPTWLIKDGDPTTKVKVQEKNGVYQIVVPEKTYNIYYWDKKVEHLKKVASLNDEALNGRSANSLAQNLREIAHLLKSSQK